MKKLSWNVDKIKNLKDKIIEDKSEIRQGIIRYTIKEFGVIIEFDLINKEIMMYKENGESFTEEEAQFYDDIIREVMMSRRYRFMFNLGCFIYNTTKKIETALRKLRRKKNGEKKNDNSESK